MGARSFAIVKWSRKSSFGSHVGESGCFATFAIVTTFSTLVNTGTAARLTAREREVLRWTAAGKTADATAEILSISVRTVEYHLLNAARKLNTANRTHTVVEALRSRQLSI